MNSSLKRLFIFSVLVIAIYFALQNFGARAGGSSSGGNDYKSGEVVVKLAQAGDLASVAADFNLEPTPIDQFGARPIYRLRIKGVNPSVEATVQALLADTRSRVIYAEPNYIATAPEVKRAKDSWSADDAWSMVGDFASYQSQYATAKLGLSTAHRTTRGAGVTVAILDTGVDRTHPALANRLLGGYDFVDMDNDPSEAGTRETGPFGHGTHVAGLVALVAPDAKILPVRVLDENGQGNIWVLVEALAYAANPDGDPATDDGADVINLSLSTLRRTRLLESVLAKVCDDLPETEDDDLPSLVNSNAIVVAAAGNGGGSVPEYPAAENLKGLIAVGASTNVDGIADFSTRGSWARVLSPGEQIISSVPGGGYGTWNGTSMAAPLVAGEAALIRAIYPNLRQSKVIDHIVRTSARVQTPISQRVDTAAAVATQPHESFIQFAEIASSVLENAGKIDIRVTRTVDTSDAVAVEYETNEPAELFNCNPSIGGQTGKATSRCDYASATGVLIFAPGETQKTLSVAITDDSHTETSEQFTLTLRNPTGASLTAQTQTVVTIQDDDSAGQANQPNPLAVNSFFIRQHYLDFFGRAPAPGEVEAWTRAIEPDCAINENCYDRLWVSGKGFFESQEFQQKGFFAYRIYKLLGQSRLPTYKEFIPDLVSIQGTTDADKAQFVRRFMARADYRTLYPASLTNAQFVQRLNEQTGLQNLNAAQMRSDLDGNIKTRAQILRDVIESGELAARESNEARVVMQYFGYLRRDGAASEYAAWKSVIERDPHNYRQMVDGFTRSTEYRQRFGQP